MQSDCIFEYEASLGYILKICFKHKFPAPQPRNIPTSLGMLGGGGREFVFETDFEDVAQTGLIVPFRLKSTSSCPQDDTAVPTSQRGVAGKQGPRRGLTLPSL